MFFNVLNNLSQRSYGSQSINLERFDFICQSIYPGLLPRWIHQYQYSISINQLDLYIYLSIYLMRLLGPHGESLCLCVQCYCKRCMIFSVLQKGMWAVLGHSDTFSQSAEGILGRQPKGKRIAGMHWQHCGQDRIGRCD